MLAMLTALPGLFVVSILAGYPLLWPIVMLRARGMGDDDLHARKLFEAGFLGFSAGGVAFLLGVLAVEPYRPGGFISMKGFDLGVGALAGVGVFWTVWLSCRASWLFRAGPPVEPSAPKWKGLAGLAALMGMLALSRWVRGWADFPGWLGA